MYRYDAAGILRRLKSTNPVAGSTDVFDLTLRHTAVDPIGRILTQALLCPAGTGIGSACGNVNNQPAQTIVMELW